MQKIMHCRRKYNLIFSNSVDLPRDSDLAHQVHILDFFTEKGSYISDFFFFKHLPLKTLDLYCIFAFNLTLILILCVVCWKNNMRSFI